MSTGDSGRILALDGIRAVAIAGVMGMHFDHHLPGGHMGVSVFFVLSGYIITTSLVVERNRAGRVDLYAFYVRRAARLIPPFLLALIPACLLVLARGMPLRDVLVGAAAAGTYVLNIARSAFGNDVGAGLGWAWSLALEEQFYLIWPAVLLVCWRRSPRWALAAAVAGVVGPFLLRFALPVTADPVPAQLYYGPHSRVSGLMLGCALALALVATDRRPGPRLSELLGVAGLVVVVVSFWSADSASASTYLWWLPLAEVATAALILAVLSAPELRVSRALAWRPIAWVGLVSYAVYLFNATIIDALAALFGYTWWVLLIWIGSTLIASAASYRGIETPIRDRARAYLRRRGEPATSDVPAQTAPR